MLPIAQQPIHTSAPQPVGSVTVQSTTPSTWGLERISHDRALSRNKDPLEFNYTYRYKNPSHRIGVDGYIIDTGVMLAHEAFGGRATFGANFTPGVNQDFDDGDMDGHGTHIGGILGGDRVGVARNVKIISVKALGADAGATELTRAVDWVTAQAMASGNPSIICICFGLPVEGADPIGDFESAVNNAVNHGVHVVVAAGNSNEDASNVTPARLASVMTVGASTIRDERWPDSNFGAVVNVFAPGANIISASHGFIDRYQQLSGTSGAAPYVAGVMVNWIEVAGVNRPPAQMIADIEAAAFSDMLDLGRVSPGTP
ncbi:unnamed protein product [Rhizoctonia solani]|uniref:Peptidase S8/S53 domain-containing protein n=1 Tax=Rhizoctonia solani TaxID=456999 RepID=A0A8H3AH44_9AGAM|nr:unnamed protein product [Rhizoctonia solani]